MEYALYPGIVVDSRVDSHRVTLDRMSVEIRQVFLRLRRDVVKALSFRGMNGTYLLMECWAVQTERILFFPEYWNLVRLHLA